MFSEIYRRAFKRHILVILSVLWSSSHQLELSICWSTFIRGLVISLVVYVSKIASYWFLIDYINYCCRYILELYNPKLYEICMHTRPWMIVINETWYRHKLIGVKILFHRVVDINMRRCSDIILKLVAVPLRLRCTSWYPLRDDIPNVTPFLTGSSLWWWSGTDTQKCDSSVIG